MEEVKKQGTESLFVPYKIALELKDLGFNEECFAIYGKSEGHLFKIHTDKFDTVDELHFIKAPTFSQAFRFFREKYQLSSEISIFKNIWNFDIEDISNSIQLYTSDIMCYNSYEEAELECLVKLIDIVKKQNVK